MRSSYALDTPRDADWRKYAACRGYNPEWWAITGTESSDNRRALAICGGCPVKTPCREFAEDTHSWGVIFGGRAFHTPHSSRPSAGVCPACTMPFTRDYPWQRFCTVSCQVAHNAVRQAAKRRAVQ